MEWKLESQVLDIRYSNEFLYWDKTGYAAKGLFKKFPHFSLNNASADKTVIEDTKNNCVMSYGYNNAFIVQNPVYDKTKHFSEIAKFFFPSIFESFEITNIQRLGNRNTYHKEMSSLKKATSYIKELSIKQNLGSNFLEKSNDERLKVKSITSLSLRFEDEKLGINIDFKALKSRITISGVAPQEIKNALPQEKFIVVLDVDIYTRQASSIDDLLVEEFIKSNKKLIETRLMPLFNL